MNKRATKLRQYAQEYTLDGLPVIPVYRKVANVLKEWNPYKTRLPTDDEITGWPWHRADGLALVISDALYETLGNVWLLDIEVEHRAEAERWLDRNAPGWRDGMNVESGSGGLHGYCVAAHPDPFGKSQSVMRWGHLKLHNALGYLPPTRHPKGGHYRWISRGKPIHLEPDRIPGVQKKQLGKIQKQQGWAAGVFRTRLGEDEGRRVVLPELVGYLGGHRIDCETAVAILELWDAQNTVPLGPSEVRKHVEDMYERYGYEHRTYSEMSVPPSHNKLRIEVR